MSFLVKLGLIFSVFASWASCFTKFIRPPERDPDQAADQDMTKNNHYDDGQTIPILFDTNIKKVDLYIWQFIDAEKNATSLLESSRTSSLLFIVLLIEPPRRWYIGSYWLEGSVRYFQRDREQRGLHLLVFVN